MVGTIGKRVYSLTREDQVTARLMKDELFEAQLLRAIGYAPYGGADAGECLAVAGLITGTSLDSWHDAWNGTAASVAIHALNRMPWPHFLQQPP